MEQNGTKTEADGTMLFAGDAWFDPIEAGIRDRVRGFIQELLEQELAAALGRGRYERSVSWPPPSPPEPGPSTWKSKAPKTSPPNLKVSAVPPS